VEKDMLLAIDTATRHVSLALHDGASLIAETSWRAGDYHTVELAPQVALMLRRAGVEPARLAGLAVAIGPGSYTALRIGLALAKGLALAHGVPLCGVLTPDILMRAQPAWTGKAFAILQAGRRRILAAPYRWQAAGWEPAGETRVLEWALLLDELAEAPALEVGGPTLLCGEIDEAGREGLRRLKDRVKLAPPAQNLRRAGYLAEIGWERLRQQRMDAPGGLAPVYAGQI
jgi:tRNA threonylcarbamoyladenosine biosynthesis protein TsaB